ncbi:MAG TPA: molybdenum cofactor guanylyltransferase [Thermomicrobiales bacterium]|nr:molybdenum cofactor guanylyltransferase [Thermomicrobiales bacterium]
MASPESHPGTNSRSRLSGSSAPLSAAALAGGASRRMGSDKALLSLVPGGEPLLGIVLEQLAHVSDDLLVVANNQERYAPFGARVVPDLHPEVGALGGIHAAIARSAHEHCLVVACDMPFLCLPLLRRMAGEPRDYDVLVPLIPGESRQRPDGLVFQTLHAIYSKRCLPFIENRIAEGKKQVIGFFEDVRVRTLDVAEVVRWDPDLRSFFNANTPEALLTAAEMIPRLERGPSN